MGRRTHRHLEYQGHGPPYISSSITSKPYLNRSKSKVLPRGSLELLLRLVDGPLLPTPAMGADDTLPSQSGGGGFRGCPPILIPTGSGLRTGGCLEGVAGCLVAHSGGGLRRMAARSASNTARPPSAARPPPPPPPSHPLSSSCSPTAAAGSASDAAAFVHSVVFIRLGHREQGPTMSWLCRRRWSRRLAELARMARQPGNIIFISW